MLLDIRLSYLNARLERVGPEARIIDIAFDLGFTHLGRMSGAYRAKFGETPSATLRPRAWAPINSKALAFSFSNASTVIISLYWAYR